MKKYLQKFTMEAVITDNAGDTVVRYYVAPSSEFHNYLLPLYDGKYLFHTRYFNKDVSFEDNIAEHERLVNSFQLSPYFNRYDEYELLRCRITRRPTKNRCPHFVTNATLLCAECQQYFPCVFCHSDQFLLDEPHTFKIDPSNVKCNECDSVCTVDDKLCAECGTPLLSKHGIVDAADEQCEQCNICYTPYHGSFEHKLTLSCGHHFHRHCYYQDFFRRGLRRCPVCQSEKEYICGVEDAKMVQDILCGATDAQAPRRPQAAASGPLSQLASYCSGAPEESFEAFVARRFTAAEREEIAFLEENGAAELLRSSVRYYAFLDAGGHLAGRRVSVDDLASKCMEVREARRLGRR